MPLSFTDDSGAAIGDTQTMDATVDDASEPVPPAGLEPASVETKERALFRMLKRAVLEHPRHATLKDSSGTLIARGEEVIIYAVLEPAAPGGVVQYSVKRLGQVVGAQGTAGFQGADEFVVPEDWLRPKGTMATSQAAEYIPIVKVLQVATRSAGLQIPLFQRRYCWSEEQWQSLWLTVVDLAAQGEDAQHSLKRLLCLVRPDGSVVLDGQQRLTTVCVLLAALRDATAAVADSIEALRQLSATITSLLTLQPPRKDGWSHVVSPTLDDRDDFVQSVSVQPLPGTAPPQHQVGDDGGGHGEGGSSSGPLVCCRAFFSARLAAIATEAPLELHKIYTAVTLGLHVLHFPLAGAVQVQSVYELAAQKAEAGKAHFLWTARSHVEDEMEENEEEGFDELSNEEILERYKQYREREGGVTQITGVREEGVEMSSVDLVRNFVHEHFEGEAAQRDVYERLWCGKRVCSAVCI